MIYFAIKNDNNEFFRGIAMDMCLFDKFIQYAYFFSSDEIAKEEIVEINLQNCKVVKVEIREVEDEEI